MDTSIRVKRTTQEKINQDKKKLRLENADEVINHWQTKSMLYEQLTKSK